MRALATQPSSFIWILVYCAAPTLLNGAENVAPLTANSQSSSHGAVSIRRHRQVSIDDLLSTALQIVKPIFDTAQPLPFESAMIPKRVSAEQSTGARESKILGAPAYSSLRDVPICRGNSQICKFISCTAHNFKYDQNLSNLNLAAQLINDRDFRKTISQNPETITTVCHEQGLSTEQCRLFSRAFQLIDKFMTSIQKPESPGGNQASGTGDGATGTAGGGLGGDDNDDGIIGGMSRKKQRAGNALAVNGVIGAPPAPPLVLDDDGAAGNRRAAELPRSKFFAGHATNTIVVDGPARQIVSGESASDDGASDDFVGLAAEPITAAPTSAAPLKSARRQSSSSSSVAPPVGPIVGSRTWSTHSKNNNNFIEQYNAPEATGAAVSRQYGRDPFPVSLVSPPISRPTTTHNNNRNSNNNNTLRINTNAQFVSFNQTNKNRLAKSRPHAPPRASSSTSAAPHAVPPRVATVQPRVHTVASVRPRFTATAPTTMSTTTASRITARPYEINPAGKRGRRKPFVEDVSLSLDSTDTIESTVGDMHTSYIPEAEDDSAPNDGGDEYAPRRRGARAAPPVLAANADYYDDLRQERHGENEGSGTNSAKAGTDIDSKTPPPYNRQNCFQYLG